MFGSAPTVLPPSPRLTMLQSKGQLPQQQHVHHQTDAPEVGAGAAAPGPSLLANQTWLNPKPAWVLSGKPHVDMSYEFNS